MDGRACAAARLFLRSLQGHVPRWRRCLAEHALQLRGCVVERLLEPVAARRAKDVFLGRGGATDLRRRTWAVDRWWRCLAEHMLRAADRVVERLEPVLTIGVRTTFGDSVYLPCRIRRRREVGVWT